MVLVNFSATIQWLLNMSYNSKTTKLTLNSVLYGNFKLQLVIRMRPYTCKFQV
jgi:hypothetical protein